MSHEDFSTKLVVVTPKTLKLSPGKLAAQVGHAAVDCVLKAMEDDPRNFKKWMSEGQKKVVVRCESSKDLYLLKRQADDLNLVTSLITDAGHTEVEPGTVTVLGVGPGPNEKIDKVTGHLKLI